VGNPDWYYSYAVSKGDDGEGIQVPFFTWEDIRDATDYFADANRLGTGGFGPVYKVIILDLVKANLIFFVT